MPEVEEKVLAALEDTLKVLAALRETLDDVGDRVNRLRDWVELELYVNELANSFEQFNGEVRRALGDAPQVNLTNMTPAMWPLLVRLWDNCRSRHLRDLDVTVTELPYLTKPLANDPASALELESWLDELRDKGDKIQGALASYAAQDLRDRCDEFDESVSRRIGLHRQRMKKEIGVLAEVSVRLRTTLEVSLPA